MKKELQKTTKLLALVFLCSLITSFAVCAAEAKTESAGTTQNTTVKNGWVNKTYYYKNGKKVKNKWLKIKKSKYYFDKKGKSVKGISVIKNKLYVFKASGKLNVAKTKKCQALAQYEKDFAPLKKILGKPIKESYYDSCYGSGQDGILEYKGYKVYTYVENGKEIFFSVQSK